MSDWPEWMEPFIEESRVKFNEGMAAMGTPTVDAEQWNHMISTPLYDPSLELVRQEDKKWPARLCAWCFHPRNSDECQFAAKHTPYREMFHQEIS